jgi:hypothetical protein
MIPNVKIFIRFLGVDFSNTRLVHVDPITINQNVIFPPSVGTTNTLLTENRQDRLQRLQFTLTLIIVSKSAGSPAELSTGVSQTFAPISPTFRPELGWSGEWCVLTGPVIDPFVLRSQERSDSSGRISGPLGYFVLAVIP